MLLKPVNAPVQTVIDCNFERKTLYSLVVLTVRHRQPLWLVPVVRSPQKVAMASYLSKAKELLGTSVYF